MATPPYANGLLLFDGGGELRIAASEISRSDARVHVDGLGLLPINFYITFDGFLTVAKSRLVWRYHDDFAVVFESWLDVRERIMLDRAR